MTLLELAERCERATGPDRGLDAMAHFARTNGIGCGAAHDAPAYTASLDAAMTLVPEGWWLQHLGHCIGGWRARVETNGPPSASIGVGCGSAEPLATPALALTAACLRARATLPEGEER